MRKSYKVSLSILLLVIGGILYIIYRDKSLIMFSWFEMVGLDNLIDNIREYVKIHPYCWIKYNLPAGLWLFSYMFMMDAIWNDCKSVNKELFIGILPAIALLSELMQIFGLCPGTFDIFDLLSYLLAIILFKTIKYYEK